MAETDNIYNFEYRQTNKIQPMGNSIGIPISKEILTEIGVKKGEAMHIYVNKELKTIMLFRPKDLAHKEWRKASFQMSLPKDIAKKLFEL